MELDFDNHAPHWLLGRSGRTRKTMLDKMQKREKNRSAELTKVREELSREMEEKMNRKLKNILEKIVQMTSLQIDIKELLADDNTDHGAERRWMEMKRRELLDSFRSYAVLFFQNPGA
ncbi:hypothetical protein DCAR_0205286 [Daucus carota subsp. sativus]|uniref:Uncharacterized protein n=1 Tax=Daucus carota subsp. sativus TaxID=79200 RepID=A0AAF0WD55_DAUCS|nr:hypothetical protein DCAR_0205286 [Daucus carota subsp. sativus]